MDNGKMLINESKIRKQAEKALEKRLTDNRDLSELTPEQTHHLVHELQVYQIELEMQNEDLHCSQQELIKSKTGYAELYDRAPVGYSTISSKGLILKANLTLADMLSMERRYLINQPLSAYILLEDQNIYYQHLKNISTLKTRQVCELRLKKKDQTPFYVQLESNVILDECGKADQYHVVVIDITKRKHDEEELAKYRDHIEELVEQRTVELTKSNNNLISEIKERKEIEASLRESEKRYKSLFKNNHSAMLFIDPENGDIVDANPAAISYYGWNHEEITRKKIIDINIFTKEKIFQEMERAEKEHRKHFFFRHRLSNGEIRDVEVYSGPIAVYGRKLLYSIIHDVTERKLAEEALENNEKEIKSLFRAAPTGIGVVRDRLIYQVNDRFCEITGYSKDELIGQNARLVYSTDEEYEYVGKEKYKQISKKGTGTVETKFKRKDEKIIDVLLSSTPIDLDDLSKGVTFTALDITYLKSKELELLESEEKYRSMMESMKDASYICSPELYIEYMNPAMIDRVGIDATGEICHKAIYDQDEKCSWCVFDQINRGDPVDYEVADPKDNRYYSVSNSPILHTDSAASKLTIFHDITEIKNIEAQLQQSQKMESIGTLAGGIAHDFNNLLFAVMGNISLAQDDLKPESGTSVSLKEAEQACIKAKELSARLITFSKGGDPVKKMMSINDLLKDTVISALNGSNIKLEIFISDDIRNVSIDEGQIKQVVRNIVINAKEAMDDNGQLTVSCENVDIAEEGYLTLNQGEYIKTSFADKGCGISKENFEKIFDPYFSTKEMGADKGQGLGLAVNYSIIQKHGGLINVESESGTGSTFSVYLPAFSIKELNLKKSEKKPEAQKPVKQPGTDIKKILLMDDEEAIRILLSRVINRLGYDVETCIEGRAAIETYKKALESKEPFDMVILDLTNKIGMGGQEAMKRLLEFDPDVKGIIITGYSDDPVVANFRAYGFSGFITKPTTRDEMSKVINEVLAKGQ